MTTTITRSLPRLTDSVDESLVHAIPEGLCRTFRVMAYVYHEGHVLVAASEADDSITEHVVAERLDRKVQGEGKVEDHQDTFSQDYDPETGTLGPPVLLPSNGSLRFKVTNGEDSRWFLLSSLTKRNDPTGGLNVCEISAGSYQR